jgi:hypothetical protein
MTNKSIRDYINLIENAQQAVEGQMPKTWHDVDPKLGKQVDKMSQAEKVKKGLAHPDTLKKKGVTEGTVYPNAEVIKSKNGKPVGEIYQDGNTWGCFHYRADRGADFLDSREDAIQELKLIHQENGRKTPDYTIKGEVDEGQLDETSPEAIAKINQITRR